METRERTVFEVEADVSRLRDLRQAIDDALDPEPVDRIHESFSDLEQVMGRLVDRHTAYARQVEELDRASGAVDRLRDSFAEVNDEAREFDSTLDYLRGKLGSLPTSAGRSPFATDAPSSYSSTSENQALDRVLPQRIFVKGTGKPKEDDGFNLGRPIAHWGMAGAGMVGQPGLGAMGSFVGGAGSQLAPTLFGAGAAVGIPLALMGMALHAGAQTAGGAEQYWTTRMHAYPFLPGFAQGTDVGGATAWGYQPTQALGMAQSFYSTVGKTGFGGQRGWHLAMALQALGVDTGTSAGFLRMFRPGRGAAEGEGDAADILAGAYGGLRDMGSGEKSEYLAHIANYIGGIGNRGGVVSATDTIGLAADLKQAGFRGTRGVQVATAMGQSAYQTGLAGPQSAVDVLLMRGAGWNGGGAAGYARALGSLQENPTGAWVNALQTMLGGLGDAPAEVKAMLVQQVMGSKGVQIGWGEARDLVTRAGGLSENGPLAFGTSVGEIVGRGAVAAGRGGGGVPQTRAAIEEERVKIGTDILPTSFELERAQINMAKVTQDLSGELLELARMTTAATAAFRELVKRLRTHFRTDQSGPVPPTEAVPAPRLGETGRYYPDDLSTDAEFRLLNPQLRGLVLWARQQGKNQ